MTAAEDPGVECAECFGPVTRPVQVEAEAAWLGDGASSFCSQACVTKRDEREQNADGSALC